ncbi:3-keto-disaccharide hydrolase [Ornithobacterium rhinotracheale]|uniref:3-keto-disaccharide hydrolase n=2 Tax=Ornithobacterium rhinotracheale TaxID=28251 RepID=UPI003FA4156A
MNFKNSIFILFFALSANLMAQKSCLFNGKDLSQWYAYSKATGVHDNAEEVFAIKDKTIQMYSKTPGYLMSKRSYKNFELTLQFRWNDDASFERRMDAKNSGVMYLVPENQEDMLWPKGIQFQIKEGTTGDFIFLQGVTLDINGKTTEAGKSVVYDRILSNEKPIGKWNKLQVICKDGKVIQKLNGKIVNQGENPNVQSGRILLQYEGFPIDFRKIKIKELK